MAQESAREAYEDSLRTLAYMAEQVLFDIDAGRTVTVEALRFGVTAWKVAQRNYLPPATIAAIEAVREVHA